MGELCSQIGKNHLRYPFRRNENKKEEKKEIQEIQEIKEIDEDKFKDKEELKDDIYVGIGIKRMKAYKCDLKIDELNKLRKEFWDIKTNYKNKNWKVWDTIKRAVSFDEMRASLLLEEYQIKTVNGCINHLIDSNGNYYNIPNFCINEPYFERNKISTDANSIKEEKLKLKIYGWKNIELEISNKAKGKDLKNEMKIKENIESDKIIRFFYKGSEIKDEDFLYNHDLNENNPIMSLVQ